MISDQDLLRSSLVRSVAAKVAASPMAKTAAAQRPVELQDAVGVLGVKIAYAHLRRARVANAVASLEALR
jgi:hypothetical protein